MVKELKKKEYLIPVILGLLFAMTYIVLPLKYVILGVIAIVGVSLVLYQVKLGLMVAVLAIPFLPDMLGLLYMLALTGVYLYTDIFKDNKKLTMDIMDLPIGLYLFVIIYSTITSLTFTGSLRDLALHLGGLSFLFVMVNTIDNKEDFNKIITTIIMSATLVSLYGLFQYVVGVEMDDAWVDVENNPDIRTRIYSVFLNPNILAEYLIMITPISVGMFWYTKELDKKIIYGLTSAIMLLSIVLTLSRGGWLGIAFAALVFVLLVERRLLLAAIPIVIAGVFFLPTTILNRILSIFNLADSSNDYRLTMWGITIRIIRDHWTSGVGFGHLPFKETFESYIRTMPTYHAHNTFLQVAAEIGLPGLLVFLFFLFIIFKYGILVLNKSEDKYIKYIGAGLISGIGGLMFHGLFENVLYIPRIIMTFWMVIAFILTLVRIERSNRKKSLDRSNKIEG